MYLVNALSAFELIQSYDLKGLSFLTVTGSRFSPATTIGHIISRVKLNAALLLFLSKKKLQTNLFSNKA